MSVEIVTDIKYDLEYIIVKFPQPCNGSQYVMFGAEDSWNKTECFHNIDSLGDPSGCQYKIVPNGMIKDKDRKHIGKLWEHESSWIDDKDREEEYKNLFGLIPSDSIEF